MSCRRPEIRRRREFGYGDFLGDKGDGFFELPLARQVKEMGWSHACPVVDSVVKEYGKEWKKKNPSATPNEVLEAGRLAARARYAECNVVFKLVAEAVKDSGNKELYKKLTSPTLRDHNEPDGDHPGNLVPNSHDYQMAPMSGIVGYALPRVIIEQMGRGVGKVERNQERIIKALEIVDETASGCQSPIELLVKISEAVVENEAEPEAVLSHLLSEGILREENCQGQFQEIIAGMKKWAPRLWETYQGMGVEERKEMGVVDMEIIEDDEVAMKVFSFRGRTQEVVFQSSGQVTNGVKCDVYTFKGDETKDLGVVRISKGFRTPIQKVEIEDGRTIEGYVKGKGKLTVIRANDEVEKFEAEDMKSIYVVVNKGDLMQWEADIESDLKVYEICYPPYEEGRFMNIGYGWI